MTVESQNMEVVLPATGEVVNLESLSEVIRALASVREVEALLREVKGVLQDAARHHSQMLGTKTLRVEGVGKLEVKGGTETVYEAEEIERGLREAGMPEERIREIVSETVTYSVRAVEAKRAAAANPAYAEVIERHRRIVEKRPSVSGP